ncbi:MAG TPA: putative Ig domain-containing protein [Verrucomicrobiae bacterium]|jgi:hypothetical protein|nr:putative Ig domain-containing protein [Verrucomicrobiae bacterium]
MKGLKPFLSLIAGFLACAIMTGCAGSIPQNPPGALNIAEFTLSNGVVGIAYKQLLVVSGGLPPYTWTINAGQLPPGLSLSTDGIISGTPTTLGQFNFTAKVTDSQTPVQAFNTVSATITISPVLSLTSSSLPGGLVGGNYSATITASNGLPPYTYTPVPPDGSTLPPGITLTTTQGTGAATVGTFSGAPTAAGVYSFTVQVNDAASEVATATYSITVVGRLQGPYVLYFNGFDGGQPFYDVASFITDGNGNVTSGFLDQVGPGSATASGVALTGTYSLPTGTNFGTLTLTRADNMEALNFAIIVSTSGDTKAILNNTSLSNTAYGSGLLKKQTLTNVPGTPTSYSFGWFGNDSGGSRSAGVGMFALAAAANGAQSVTGGEEDLNDNGTVTATIPITGGTLTQLDTTSGRGSYTVTTSSGTSNYIYYVVSPTELVAIDTDSGGPQALVDLQQQQLTGASGAFSNGSLSGQSVLALNGTATGSGGLVPSAAVGSVTFDGAGNIARTDGLNAYYTDESDGGTVSTVQYASGTYNVDPTCGTISSACGRVTVNLSGAPTQPVWYLINTNQAFSMDTNAGVTTGSLQAQTVPSGGFSIVNLLGSYLGSTITPVLPSVVNELDVAATPPPGGIWAQTFNASGDIGIINQAPFLGNYDCGGTPPACSNIGAAYGRFETTLTVNGTQNQVSIVYVIGSGTSGITGSKGGLVSLNVGQQSDGSEDPNPRITMYSR